MDTRSKILTPQQAVALPGCVAVTAAFDLLRGALIADLDQLRAAWPGATLLAVVLPDPEAVLPLQARLELAAAMAMVDYVVTLELGQLEGFLASLAPAATVRWEAAERARTLQLKEHVQRGHKQERR